MANTGLPNSLRGLVLSAVEIKNMTSWPPALIEDYLTIIENLFIVSEEIFGITAMDIETDTALFDKMLSPADDDIQKALDTLDDHTHPYNIVNTAVNYNAVINDFINADTSGGSITITPPVGINGQSFYVKKTDTSANTVVITGVKDIAYQNTTIHLVYNGTVWGAA